MAATRQRIYRRQLALISVAAVLTMAACNLSQEAPVTPTIITSTPVFVAPDTLLSVTPLPGVAPTSVNDDGSAPSPDCPYPAGWIAYTLQPGDSLGSLADQTDTTVDQLLQSNCLVNADTIYAGEPLYLPSIPTGG